MNNKKLLVKRLSYKIYKKKKNTKETKASNKSVNTFDSVTN